MAINQKQIHAQVFGLAPLKREATKEEMDVQLKAAGADSVRRRDRGYFVFSSGRSTYCHAERFSVSEEGKISYGYDGGVPWPTPHWSDDEPTDDDLTANDMRELADMMILRWQQFRASLK